MHEFMSPDLDSETMRFTVRAHVLLHEVYHAGSLRLLMWACPVVGELVYKGECPHHVPIERLVKTVERSPHPCWKHKGIMHGQRFSFEARNISQWTLLQ